MSSNYMPDNMGWNDGSADLGPDEVECKRCRGLGEDADGADCVFCDGYGSLFLR